MNREQISLPGTALVAVGGVDVLRVLAGLFTLGAAAVVLSLIFVPWQQSVHGPGRVIAYAPLERQQAVEAPTDGRVVHWYVQEGDSVKASTPIVDLSDNDPEILDRLRRERASVQTQVDTIGLSISLTDAQVVSLEAARDAAVLNAGSRVQMAKEGRNAAARALDAARATELTASLNLDRTKKLHEKGLTSKRDLERAELSQQTALAEVDRAQSSLRASNAEVKALNASQSQVASSNKASIESLRSSLEKLKGDKAKAEGELTKVQVRLARQEQMQVVAPRDGTILKLIANQGAEMVKAGDPLVLLVPDADSRAVELYVDGNDAPLIDPGRLVRLQFEGWPALQFVGWPSAAVGTFGGKVAFVDSHGDPAGRFRVMVVPDGAEEWPQGRYLRQGVRAKGWVLLNQVALGFELWRQFNGFPPALPAPESAIDAEKNGKK